MKLKVLETFEQGLPKADGGAIKLLAGEYAVTETAHGLVVTIGNKQRTLPKAVVEKLKGFGLIAVE
jgi:hypothetical protein